MTATNDSVVALSGRVRSLVASLRSQFDAATGVVGTTLERTAFANIQADCATLIAAASGGVLTALNRLNDGGLARIATLLAAATADTTGTADLITEDGTAITTEDGSVLQVP